MTAEKPTWNFREATDEDIKFAAEHSISRGPKELPQTVDFVYALEHEGNILGVGGIKVLNPDSAWAWMQWTEHSREHVRTCYRVVKEWMELLMKVKNIKRLMAAVECDFDEAILTAEHLGFIKEGVMPRWIEGRPAFLYAKFAPGGE